jgi:hypothetical protein
LVAGAVGLEWHLLWAALSGMEALLAGLAALLFLWLLLKREAPPYLLGLLLGAAVWIRPDLLSLLIPAGWYWLFQIRPGLFRWRWPIRLALGIVSLFLPYILFQWSLTGSFWPSTFYAKQAEYAALRSLPWLSRFAQQWLAPLAGPLVLLLPAIGYWTWRRAAAGQWAQLAPFLWVLVYVATFATRLPVTYQHGRYAMPVLPTLLVIGLLGILEWIQPGATRSRLGWVIERAWLGTLAVLSLIFIVLGAEAYARDVAIIETEMVDTALWINENTDPGSLIAAHDIGALGYFGDRPLVDLAGLVSPQVIHFIRDEPALAIYMDEQGVDYLMTFPDWYPQLVANLEAVHSTEAGYSPLAGGTNMTVYAWPK